MGTEANATVVFPCGTRWDYDPTEVDEWDQDGQVDAHEATCSECAYWHDLAENEDDDHISTRLALDSTLSANDLNAVVEKFPDDGTPVSGDWLVRLTRGPHAKVPA